MYYHDLDYGLCKERVAQMRNEVERNRLEARFAKAVWADEDGILRKGITARCATVITALFFR
jgi:hypothetical protein